MFNPLILAPVVGVGIGFAAAYGVSHQKRRIHFVEEDHLDSELQNLDIDVRPRDTCVECEEEINPEEIGAIVRDDGEYKVVCDKPRCLDTYDLE